MFQPKVVSLSSLNIDDMFLVKGDTTLALYIKSVRNYHRTKVSAINFDTKLTRWFDLPLEVIPLIKLGDLADGAYFRFGSCKTNFRKIHNHLHTAKVDCSRQISPEGAWEECCEFAPTTVYEIIEETPIKKEMTVKFNPCITELNTIPYGSKFILASGNKESHTTWSKIQQAVNGGFECRKITSREFNNFPARAEVILLSELKDIPNGCKFMLLGNEHVFIKEEIVEDIIICRYAKSGGKITVYYTNFAYQVYEETPKKPIKENMYPILSILRNLPKGAHFMEASPRKYSEHEMEVKGEVIGALLPEYTSCYNITRSFLTNLGKSTNVVRLFQLGEMPDGTMFKVPGRSSVFKRQCDGGAGMVECETLGTASDFKASTYVYCVYPRGTTITQLPEEESIKEAPKPEVFSIYKVELVELKANSRVVKDLGCNGVNHAECVEEIWFEKNGEVNYARHISQRVTGKCDRSCGSKGWFSV